MILVLFLKWFLFNIGCNFYIIGLLYVENVGDKKLLNMIMILYNVLLMYLYCVLILVVRIFY